MSTIITIIIIWAIFQLLGSSRTKRPQTKLPQRDPDQQPAPTYKLPPDLKEKWGKKETPQQQPKEPPAPVIQTKPAECPRPTGQVDPTAIPQKVAKSKPISPSPKPVQHKIKAQTPNNKVNPCPSPANDDNQCQANFPAALSPGLLKQGIILSEVLGPPVARRKHKRYQ